MTEPDAPALPPGQQVMPVPQNAQLNWNYLVSHGFSANAAAGILGNIKQESGGSSTAGVPPSNYGLIQRTPASRYFSSPASLEAQLPAIIGYIQENGSIADVNAHAASPSAAALYFSEKYERPLASEANNDNRMNSANKVFQAAPRPLCACDRRKRAPCRPRRRKEK